MKNNRFVFEISVDGPGYNEENIEDLYGKGAGYCPDFSEHSIAMDDVYSIFKDALLQQMEFKINALIKPDPNEETQKAYLEHVDASIDRCRKVQGTLKFVRKEEI